MQAPLRGVRESHATRFARVEVTVALASYTSGDGGVGGAASRKPVNLFPGEPAALSREMQGWDQKLHLA